jgi:hypothetical protein
MAWKRNSNEDREMFDEPQGEVLLELDDSNVIVAEDSEFNGNEYFNIRKFYKNKEDLWGRGKGLSVPLDMKDELLEAISNYMENGPKKKTKTRREVLTSKTNTRRTPRREVEEEQPRRRTAQREVKEEQPRRRTTKTEKETTTRGKTTAPRRASRLSDF